MRLPQPLAIYKYIERAVLSFVMVTLFSVLIFSCKKQVDSSGTNFLAIDKPRSVLVVVSGGFNSCVKNTSRRYDPREMTMYKQIVAHSKAMTASLSSIIEKSDTIASCYTRKIIGAGEEAHFVRSTLPIRIEVGTRNSFFKAVTKMANDGQYTDIIILGHSYGGWTAMQLAGVLGQGNIPFAFLGTVDPISPLTCTPANILKSDTHGEVGFTGCQQSPSDISVIQHERIADATILWHNFYQKDFDRLHSSNISQADENTLKVYGRSVRNAHSEIASDPKVWQQLFTDIRKNFESINGLGSGSGTQGQADKEGSSDQSGTNDSTDNESEAQKADEKQLKKLGSEMKFLLLASPNEQIQPLVTAPDQVTKVLLCEGGFKNCITSQKARLKFEGGLNINAHQGFKATAKLQPHSDKTYTFLGFDADGNLLAAQSVIFIKKA